MRIGYNIGRAVRTGSKLVLPVTKWVAQQSTSFASEFVKGMAEQPTLITQQDENYHQNSSDIDNQIQEAIQPELNGLEDATPEQPIRSSQ
tara:strand:- start:451 stop:720 length:270 start_codon:yes stop_codon:yes gene_type:complete